MPLARTYSVALVGVTGYVVEVEADIANGLVGMILVGLPDTALREARDRIRTAIVNSGEEWPQRRITVGLSPASLPKRGSWFDLAIAVGILTAAGKVPRSAVDGVMFFGDRVAAFTNMRRAAAPDARMALVCWRSLAENPWMEVPMTAAAQHLPLAQCAAGQLDLELLEYLAHAHRQRLVQDQSQGAALGVIAHERHGLREVRVAHRRHGDEQLIGQVIPGHRLPIGDGRASKSTANRVNVYRSAQGRAPHRCRPRPRRPDRRKRRGPAS